MISLWVTARHARALGCTHHARFLGLVPGFFNPDTAVWVSRSDLLNPIEDLLSLMWVTMNQTRGDEPEFFWALGKPIRGVKA